jgi:hypothetical protein
MRILNATRSAFTKPGKMFPLVAMLLVFLALSGMGSTPPGATPVPDAEFAATVIDAQGMSTKCTTVSWEGKTFFPARRGRGIITISFARVKKVEFLGETTEKSLDAQITLKSGEVVAVAFEPQARFFGNTSFGTYWITSKNIREIIFN